MDKSKIVHEWNIEIINSSEQFKETYNSCGLCGGKLVFVHNTNFLYGEVEEQASCTLCNVEQKKRKHSLQ